MINGHIRHRQLQNGSERFSFQTLAFLWMWDTGSLEQVVFNQECTETWAPLGPQRNRCAFCFYSGLFSPRKTFTVLFFSFHPPIPASYRACKTATRHSKQTESLFLPACQLTAPTGFTDFQHIFNYISLGVQLKPEAVHKSIGSEWSLTFAWNKWCFQEKGSLLRRPLCPSIYHDQEGFLFLFFFTTMINPLFTPYDLFALFINNWAEGKNIFLNL